MERICAGRKAQGVRGAVPCITGCVITLFGVFQGGRFIAGLYTGPTGGIKIFDFETKRWSIVQRTGECDFPTWSSDSQFIYFVLPWDDPGVFRIRVSGGNAERVVDLKGFRYTGAFNLWMGLDPTDTPMLLRDVGTDDIYALTLEEK